MVINTNVSGCVIAISVTWVSYNARLQSGYVMGFAVVWISKNVRHSQSVTVLIRIGVWMCDKLHTHADVG